MQTLIRKAVQSDIPYVYTICLQTGDNGKDASDLFSDPWIIGQYYAAPYLFHDISLCFIVEAAGVPKGYIIGTANTPIFNSWLESDWLPPLRGRYAESLINPEPRSEAERKLVIKIKQPAATPDPTLAPWIADYPAHLHIDILPELQGLGLGRSLIGTLVSALKTRKCPGVHLGVSAGNPGAIQFYQKMGFSVLVNDVWGKIMGLRL